MRIESIDVEPYRAHLSPPMVTSRGAAELREGFLLRLRDQRGRCGWGEAAPIHWLEGNLERCRQVLRDLLAATGSSIADLRQRHARILSQDASAACALDTALCDLEARQAQLPLWRWLAGTRSAEVACKPRPHIPTPRAAALLSPSSPRALAEQSRRLLSRGYRCFKLKVGTAATKDDVERIAAVRDVFDGSLRLDANGAWTLEQAQAACAAFECFDVCYLEDPLPPPRDHRDHSATHAREAAGHRGTRNEIGVEQWRRLAGGTGIALALDAGAEQRHLRTALIDASAVSYVILKLARTGGPSAAMEIVRSLGGGPVRCVFSDSAETGIGQRAALHCAAAAHALVADPTDEDVGLAGAVMIDGFEGGGRLAQTLRGNLRGPKPKLDGFGLG